MIIQEIITTVSNSSGSGLWCCVQPVPKIAKTGLSAVISSRVHYYHEGTRFPE